MDRDTGLLDVFAQVVKGLYRWGSRVEATLEFVDASIGFLDGRCSELVDKLVIVGELLRERQGKEKRRGEGGDEGDEGEGEGKGRGKKREEYGVGIGDEVRKGNQLVSDNLNNLNNSIDQTSRDSVIIDSDSSIILSSIFGSIFIRTIEILSTPNNVQFQSFGPSVHEYFDTGCNSVIVKVKDHTSYHFNNSSDKHKEKGYVTHIETQLTYLLSQINLIYTSNTLQPIAAKEPPIESDPQQIPLNSATFYVDLFNWYCSCDQYHQCLSADWIDNSTPIYHNTSPTKPPQLFDLIAIDKISPIPVCPHLLAVLIIKQHHNLPLYTTHQITDFSCI